jgi:hypothetical protein
MKTFESYLTNVTGTFPNTVAINATGPGTTDGTEFIAEYLNDAIFGVNQAVLDNGNVTPTGATESPTSSQFLQGIHQGFGIGPGTYKWYGKLADPSVTGDRVLLLSGQGVLRAAYPALDNAVYVGDGNNPTAPYFYRADDAGGVTRNIAGVYLILPPGKQLYEKEYSEAAGDFTVTSSQAGWVTDNAVAVPYQTEGGAWWLKGHISGDFTSASPTFITISLTGTVFKTTTARQNVSCNIFGGGTNGRNAAALQSCEALSGVGNIQIQTTGTSSLTTINIQFDVELDSEPTFTDGFNYPLAITY